MGRDICERTFEFAVRVVKLCRVLDETAGVNRTLAGQLLRAGTSVGANVEEAQGGQRVKRTFFPNSASPSRKRVKPTIG